MYLVRVTPPMNFSFSDDSLFLKKILGGGLKFSEFACFLSFLVTSHLFPMMYMILFLLVIMCIFLYFKCSICKMSSLILT